MLDYQEVYGKKLEDHDDDYESIFMGTKLGVPDITIHREPELTPIESASHLTTLSQQLASAISPSKNPSITGYDPSEGTAWLDDSRFAGPAGKHVGQVPAGQPSWAGHQVDCRELRRPSPRH